MNDTELQHTDTQLLGAESPEEKKGKCLMCKFVLMFSCFALLLVLILTVVLKLQPFDEAMKAESAENVSVGAPQNTR